MKITIIQTIGFVLCIGIGLTLALYTFDIMKFIFSLIPAI
jgi:hypothetical protein